MRITYAKLERIIERARATTTDQTALSCLDDVQFHSCGYAEPGYAAPKNGWIAPGNWNCVTAWNDVTHSFDTLDDTMPQLAEKLEKMGVELEWCDEWIECDECHKLVRSSPDNYGWTQSYWQSGCVVLCHECVKDDPTPYLEEIEGDYRRGMTIDIDLEKHGYVLLESDFEHGYHSGQDASPKVIAESLKQIGVERFIFVLDSVGQFDMQFSVWVSKEEFARLSESDFLKAEWAALPKNGARYRID